MKTPDDTKKGLECCTQPTALVYEKCDNCPYRGEQNCISIMKQDTLTYIRQLEKELAELRLLKSWDDFPERMGR